MDLYTFDDKKINGFVDFECQTLSAEQALVIQID